MCNYASLLSAFAIKDIHARHYIAIIHIHYNLNILLLPFTDMPVRHYTVINIYYKMNPHMLCKQNHHNTRLYFNELCVCDTFINPMYPIETYVIQMTLMSSWLKTVLHFDYDISLFMDVFILLIDMNAHKQLSLLPHE